MILLVATICVLAKPPEVECRTEVFRTDHTLNECRAMLKPAGEWLRETTAGQPVVYIAAACRAGGLA